MWLNNECRRSLAVRKRARTAYFMLNEFYYTRINLPGEIMYEYKFECTNWKCKVCLYSEAECGT